MDYVKVSMKLHIVFLCTLVTGLTSQSSWADYDCVKLDPRVKLSEQTEIEVSGSAETVYKIAKAGGKVAIEAKSAAQNVQESVPISEAGNAQNRLLYLLCEMMSKDDIPTDKKIELYKYVTDRIAPTTNTGAVMAGEGIRPQKDSATEANTSLNRPKPNDAPIPKVSEASVKKVISNPKVKIDIYSSAAPRGAQKNSNATTNASSSAEGAQPIVAKASAPAPAVIFNDDCKQELGFQYTRYKQTAIGAKYALLFIQVRNNKLFRCDECVDKLVRFIASKTDIPLGVAIDAGWGMPGCIGYREDLGGTLKGAQCLQALLGDHYKVDRENCSMDGFPYPIKLRE